MDETVQPEPAKEGPPPSNRKAMFIVFLVVFIDLLGFGIVLPLLPLYATKILVPLLPGEGARVLRGVTLGLLMSSFSLMQFLFAPMWGRISDHVGRRPILLLGLTGSVIFYGVFAVASEIGLGASPDPQLALILLFVARLGAGVAGATISTAQAVIADSTAPEKRAHGMALIGAAFGIGFTFGPLLGLASLFVPVPGAPGYAATAFSLVALVLAVRLLPETLKSDSKPVGRRVLFDFHGLRDTLTMPSVGSLILVFFLATWAFGGLESTLALVNRVILNPGSELRMELSAEADRETLQTNFLIFAYVGMVLMMIQGFVYRRFVSRVGEVHFMKIGVGFMFVGLAGAVGILLIRNDIASTTMLVLLALGVMTLAVIGFAFLTPSVQALVSKRSDPNRQGEVLGVNQSASAIARILGPLVGLSLFTVDATHIWPFVFGAGLLAFVFLLTLRIKPEPGE
ncbi:MAG: MFS transporter [Gemmataceae bacterium]